MRSLCVHSTCHRCMAFQKVSKSPAGLTSHPQQTMRDQRFQPLHHLYTSDCQSNPIYPLLYHPASGSVIVCSKCLTCRCVMNRWSCKGISSGIADPPEKDLIHCSEATHRYLQGSYTTPESQNQLFRSPIFWMQPQTKGANTRNTEQPLCIVGHAKLPQ